MENDELDPEYAFNPEEGNDELTATAASQSDQTMEHSSIPNDLSEQNENHPIL